MNTFKHTFVLPDHITGSDDDRSVGKAMVDTLRRDGILQIASNPKGQELQKNAFDTSRQFFYNEGDYINSPGSSKCVFSREEVTNGIYSEMLTVANNSDPKAQANPLSDNERKPIESYTEWLGLESEKLLRLIEYGIGIPEKSFTKYTRDEWHCSRILRLPPTHLANGEGSECYKIGSDTHYGLLIIAPQNDDDGLFIRPPHEKMCANWDTAGKEDGWAYIPSALNVYTVFLGDILQCITTGHLTATTHKLGLSSQERFAFAYFHEVELPGHPKPSRGPYIG